MSAVSKMKVSHRLLSSYAVCIALIVLVGALGVTWLRQLEQMQREMYETEVVPLKLAGTASWQAATHFRRMYAYILKPWTTRERAETLGP